jgi:hypothetical protein
MTPPTRKDNQKQPSEAAIVRRRDDAVHRALNTPPKPHKDMKIGKRKKRQNKPTAPEKRT